MRLVDHFPKTRPVLILAPMQDVTDLAFWKVMQVYGGPDVYFTEYLRVHIDSRPERHILKAIRENPTGKPVIAQMIGRDIPSLLRTAKLLEKENVTGIDLNLGCPAPIVCSKKAGGGLLKFPHEIKEILKALRENVASFTVKTRLGSESIAEFPGLLSLYHECGPDMLTVHGRTVLEMYRTEVHYEEIKSAVETMACPVIANGNVVSVDAALDTMSRTGAAGLMIGRGAIRNPWIFKQITEFYESGHVSTRPTLRDLHSYVHVLYKETVIEELPETSHVAKMKKYMNFIAQGIDQNDAFLHEMRRAVTESDFFKVLDNHLLSDALMPSEPPAGAFFCKRSAQLEQSKKSV